MTRFVATPTLSGAEREGVALLAAELADAFDALWVDDAGNLVARQGEGAVAVTFLGHVDTVPGQIPVEVVDGVLHGRGAVDAKGPLCAALAAAAKMGDAARSALTVRVVGAVGEEAPGSVGARHAAATLPVPDLLIVCEPSGWDGVTLGYKGRLGVELTCERPGAHSAGPEANASDRVVEAYRCIRERLSSAEDVPAAPGAFDRVQVALLDIVGGSDGMRDVCRARLGIRLPPALPPDAAWARIEASERPDGVHAERGESVPAVRGPRDTPLVRAFRRAIRGAGGRARTSVKTGTADMNVVAEPWPVPMVAYGPGDAALDHTPHERLSLREFDASVGVLRAVLDDLAHRTHAGGAASTSRHRDHGPSRQG